ncbi:MAG: tetratricopeptide repeat protein [Candidatus Rokubacteria bacterium]|nr:tetratricopeptide repeat protein [Candidatus Rokubacteria bacterium]
MARLSWTELGKIDPWRWVLVGGVALLVLLGVGFGAWSWYRAAQARGLEAVTEAGALARDALAPQGTAAQRDAAIRKLEEVIARYPSNRLVPEAAYHLGNLRYQAGAYEAARGAYTLALAKGAGRTLAPLCGLGIGYTWEAEGKYGEALAAYRDALTRLQSTDFLYEETLMGLARAEELSGKLVEAREIYRRILRELPQTRRADDIRGRLASLESRARP